MIYYPLLWFVPSHENSYVDSFATSFAENRKDRAPGAVYLGLCTAVSFGIFLNGLQLLLSLRRVLCCL